MRVRRGALQSPWQANREAGETRTGTAEVDRSRPESGEVSLSRLEAKVVEMAGLLTGGDDQLSVVASATRERSRPIRVLRRQPRSTA